MIRRKNTKELLGESIQELAKSLPVDKITIREIVENCGLSPATFYRHFRDKYELIAWIYNYQMEDIFLDFCEGAESWRQVLCDLANILARDRSFYKNAFKNTGGQNSFSLATHSRCVELLTCVVVAKSGEPVDEELLFDVKFYLQGISCSVGDWFLNDSSLSTERLIDYILNFPTSKYRLKP